MSNIKVGGRVFRNVEKMSLKELEEVRVALVQRQQQLVTQGKSLSPTAAGRNRFMALDRELKELEPRFKKVDALAKEIIKKDTAAKLARIGDVPEPAA